MPPKGYKTVSIRESLYKKLHDLGASLNPTRSVADTIEYLFQTRKAIKGYAEFRKMKGLDLFTKQE